MEQLLKEHERLESKANLSKACDDVDALLQQLKNTREAVAQDPDHAADRLDTQYKLAKSSFDRIINDDLKEVHTGLGRYSKVLEKKFNKDKPLPFAETDALASHTSLINRAIAMHLLREGHFDVAADFVSEANANPAIPPNTAMDIDSTSNPTTAQARHLALTLGRAPSTAISTTSQRRAWETDFPSQATNANNPITLQEHFSEMYHILEALRQHQNLEPAIAWARTHSAVLEARGSNLEYDLCRLQYIKTFLHSGPVAALQYARTRLSRFPKYLQQTQELMGALAFIPDLARSPYANLFSESASDPTHTASNAFTSEFCALLSLSSASPLLTAVTAGCIALPTLLKLSQIQQAHRTSWTTASELPVEVPLPSAYQFHSVFVCPVSKEQSTDMNPPMMMPCHHVICAESLERVSRGGKFKCPYCPAESVPADAVRVFL